jgi:putative ABC transport system substrate-binding protein
MRRRDFISILGAAAVWPLAAHAQQQAPIVGLLDAGGNMTGPLMAAFHRGLNESGFIEGKNVTVDYRSAQGEYDRLRTLAADLARRQVAVIAAVTPVAALAAKAATTTTPIVFNLGSDPVKDGLVASLNRPGGNITGVTFFSNLLAAKRMERLHDLLPDAAVVAMLLNPNNANAELELNDAELAARTLGLKLIVFRATTEHEIDMAFASLAQQGASALLVAVDAFFGNRMAQILALAARHAIATCVGGTRDVAAGGLMSYGVNRLDTNRQFGIYTGRILKGEKPADLPVIQPTKFEFAVNLKTAKALGLTVSRDILLLADEVVE